MPHSLRAKLGGLRYKGILEDKDYKRLCKALDNEDALEQIKAEAYQQGYDDARKETAELDSAYMKGFEDGKNSR